VRPAPVIFIHNGAPPGRWLAAMVDLYCESFGKVPKRITLDIDDTFDAVHGGQQLRLFNAHYDEMASATVQISIIE